MIALLKTNRKIVPSIEHLQAQHKKNLVSVPQYILKNTALPLPFGVVIEVGSNHVYCKTFSLDEFAESQR